MHLGIRVHLGQNSLVHEAGSVDKFIDLDHSVCCTGKNIL